MTLQAQLEALRDNTLKEIAQVATLKELNQIRVETLGKKGPITEVLRGMKTFHQKNDRWWGALQMKFVIY